jgi:soluble lytic murein transglycosylase-like protein
LAARAVFIALLSCLPAFAGEFAILSNGFRLYADRHESNGTAIRLFANGGMTEIAASNVVRFEQEEYVRPASTQAAASPQAPTLDPQKVIEEAARRYGENPEFVRFVRSVAKIESDFQQNAVSRKGALGLMQLMPSTARRLGVDPSKPDQNADGGARYLSELLLKYQGQSALALAAYNAGPGAVDKYKGIPPYPETVQYVQKVLRHYSKTAK